MDTLNPLKRLDISESVNLHKCLILLDSCRIHATRCPHPNLYSHPHPRSNLWLRDVVSDRSADSRYERCEGWGCYARRSWLKTCECRYSCEPHRSLEALG